MDFLIAQSFVQENLPLEALRNEENYAQSDERTR